MALSKPTTFKPQYNDCGSDTKALLARPNCSHWLQKIICFESIMEAADAQGINTDSRPVTCKPSTEASPSPLSFLVPRIRFCLSLCLWQG